MSDGPNWREVREAVEGTLLSQLAVILNRLYAIGLKGVVVLARMGDPAMARSTGFSLHLGGAAGITQQDFDTLLAAAAAHNPQVQSLMRHFEERNCVDRQPGVLSALDFASASAQFEEVASRLLTPEKGGEQP